MVPESSWRLWGGAHVPAVELVPRLVSRWQASPGVGLARQSKAPTHDQADPLPSVAVLVVQFVDEVG